jgi:hypothetical protein
MTHRGVFVLRWSEDEPDWGHLAVAPPQGRPVFIGFVRLTCDPVFHLLALENSIPCDENGMREVWFAGQTYRDLQKC